MTFNNNKKKLAWFGLGFLATLLLCIPLCSSKSYTALERPYSQLEKTKCQKLANSFEMFLKTQAEKSIRDSKGQNPELLELVPIVTVIKCVSETKVQINLKVKLKVRRILREQGEEDTKTQVLCGISNQSILLEQDGTLIRPTLVNKNPKPVSLVPCK